MKKKIIMFVLMLLILAIVIITFVKIDNNDKNKPKDLTKVKLAEVTPEFCS